MTAIHLFALLATIPQAITQDSRTARVDSIFAPFAVAGSPGCAVGVIQDGKLTYARGYGFANLDYDVPIDARSVFYMASVSKQFTAFAVALAAQEGKLSLDDDVRKYIPELRDYGSTVTIRHLIHHTSGVRDYLTLIPLAGRHSDDTWTDAALLTLITRQKALNFAPGTEYLYSNTGYVLLAEIVRRATGQSLAQYAGARIFKPLGMRDTHFHDDAGVVVPRRVIGYTRDPSGAWRMNHWFSFDKVGDGGLYSTIEDLAKWDANFYSGQVGGASLQKLVQQRGVLAKGDTLGYAFGLQMNTYRGLPIIEHGGSLTGFRTAFLRFPEQRFSTVVLCNTTTSIPAAFARRVAVIYLGDRMMATGIGDPIPGPPPQPSPPPILTAEEGTNFIGSYRSEELDAVYVFAVDSGRLVMRSGGSQNPVRRSSPDLLSAGNVTLRFTRDVGGRANGFTLDAGRVRGIRFDRLPGR
jgi:CubicO group peptidase (beta-lactamase class C family)